MGRYLLTTLIVLSMGGTAVADLGYMHAGNEAWPPHAQLHGIWGVTHVIGTHGLALGLLWIGTVDIVRIRIAGLILLAYMMSFFGALILAPYFGAAIEPDLPQALMPPKIVGMDGNLASFLIGLPVLVLSLWLSERELSRER